MKSCVTIAAAGLVLFLAAAGLSDATERGVGVANTLDKDTASKVYSAKPSYSPYTGRNYPTQPFFGDTHLHTGFSMDAGAFGARLTPTVSHAARNCSRIPASPSNSPGHSIFW